jgi:hypothetical protein
MKLTPISIWYHGQENVELYLHFPICLHSVHSDYFTFTIEKQMRRPAESVKDMFQCGNNGKSLRTVVMKGNSCTFELYILRLTSGKV